MIQKKLKELKEAKGKVSQLEQTIEAERKKALAALPSQYGYDDVATFIRAVKAAAGGRSAPKKGGGRRKRAIINAETKKRVKALHQAGKTGAAIASEVGISVPSVQNIKKEQGLTKPRKK